MSVPSNLIPTRISELPSAPSADPNGLLPFVLNGVTYKIAAIDLLQVTGVPTSRNVLAGTGMTGGGPLSSDVTLSVAIGGIGTTQLASTGATPGSYGSSNMIPVITVDATGRITVVSQTSLAAPGFGTVTSVDASGGTTGMSFSGGPIIGAGTLTMAGTLAVANGGTGGTTSTGTGAVVLATSPTLVTPLLGTPTSGVLTNCTGTAAGLTAGSVTTNANLTGPITSVGNATSIASQTGTGSKFVVDTSPTLVTPLLGTPTSGVLTNCTGTAAGLTAGNVTTNANLTGDVTSVGNATTLTNAPVIAKVLTGYTSGAGTVAATDSILQAIQKLNGNDATNANLTGPITSTGNATAVASQTGTGSTFVMDTSPTLVTPALGTPSALVGTNITGTATGLTAGSATTAVTATNIAGGIASQIPYQTAAGATSFIANGTAGQVLTSTGTTAPAWGGISGGTF